MPGKAKRSFEQVNLEQLLEKDCLGDLFPAETWPELNAVRDLATEMKAARKGKSLTCNCVVCCVAVKMYSAGREEDPLFKPFVNTDLKKYVVPFVLV